LASQVYKDWPAWWWGRLGEIAVSWPTLAIWLCTSRCNAACRHCYVANRFMGPELTKEEALKMVGELAEGGTVHLAFTGGEPFLRPDVLEIAREAVELGLKVSFNTNGSLVDERLARELRDLDAFVFLSLDGTDREICEALRGPGSWRGTLKAVSTLRSYGVEFSIIMTITSLNYDQGRKHVLLCESVGAWEAIFLPLIPAGRAAGQGRGLVPKPLQVMECLRAAEEAAEEVGYRATVWCAPFAVNFARSKRLYVAPCSEGVADISPQGDLLLCDTLDLKAGNVRESFSKAWEELTAFKERFLADRDVDDMGPCSNCPVKAYCEGGCLARALLMAGDVGAPDPLCPRVASSAGRPAG